ncbi:hypothetical protein HPB47_014384 [Ixodes persulcatus]|uniref:Uncharacterized protein n=1 Tax=Ixodes persulcatus TaxID=34615 RepID=A0AC60QW72_IXOPE|nr:hypothetical protein HPB47_014384 [Ixodes persulcatus]
MKSHGPQIWKAPWRQQDLPRLCVSSGCRWLEGYLRSGGGEAQPCEDFYGHVCGRRHRTVYQDGLAALMNAMESSLQKEAAINQAPHAALFERCLRGKPALWRSVPTHSSDDDEIVTGKLAVVRDDRAPDEFKVKDRRWVLVDPCNQDVRLKLHWLLHHDQDDEVRAALAPYGKVTGVTRDKWRVPGCTDMASTTRSVSLKLKPGVTVDDLPHQLRITGDLALVVVPGRAPLCLRCKGKGHIRRECRVPRCTLCRRFGHDESQCVRTYASVTGPMGIDDNSEHLMDVADAEEAASGASDGAYVTPASEAEEKQGKADAALGADATRNAGQPDTPPAERAATGGVEASVVEGSAVDATMRDGENSASCPDIKRSRVDDVTDPSAASHEEPPPKATPLRRPRLNIKPKVPVDDPRVAKPPP